MSNRSDRDLAYALLRFAFGVNFFGHGLVRVVTGTGHFAEGVIKGFQHSPLPEELVTPISYAIPFIELALGLGLMLGLFCRSAYVLGSLFMCLLTFGSAMKNDFAAVGQQLLYSLVFFVLLFLSGYNRISIDHMVGHGRYEAPDEEDSVKGATPDSG